MSSGLVNLHADRPRSFASGELDVWRARLSPDEYTPFLESLLARDELQRANRFRFPEHRQRFVIARGNLRQLLAGYLQIAAREIEFTYGPEGKPALSPRHGSDVSFNVSHSGDIAAFAFTRGRRIGIDVEMVRHDVDIDQIPQRFFSRVEQKMLSNLQGAAKFRGFFNCWTRKEAYVKAVGSGLSLPLRDFDVSLAPGEPAQLLATRPDATLASSWSMADLDFGSSCAAAVVVEGTITRLDLRTVHGEVEN